MQMKDVVTTGKAILIKSVASNLVSATRNKSKSLINFPKSGNRERRLKPHTFSTPISMEFLLSHCHSYHENNLFHQFENH